MTQWHDPLNILSYNSVIRVVNLLPRNTCNRVWAQGIYIYCRDNQKSTNQYSSISLSKENPWSEERKIHPFTSKP